MTTRLNPDHNPQKAPMLPFAAADMDRAGIRVTRSELARLLGVSKQTAGEWVKAGKIVLGADGRVDPRAAVRQLLRNSDPARLRSKVLAPLLGEADALRARVASLENELARARDERDFDAGANAELIAQWGALLFRLRDEWVDLRAMPPLAALEALDAWAAAAEEVGGDPGGICAAGLLCKSPVPLEGERG